MPSPCPDSPPKSIPPSALPFHGLPKDPEAAWPKIVRQCVLYLALFPPRTHPPLPPLRTSNPKPTPSLLTVKMAPPGPREGSPTFFTTFKGYTFDASLTVLENFQRLAIKRGWAVTSPTWRRNWSACFSRPFTADQNPFLYVRSHLLLSTPAICLIPFPVMNQREVSGFGTTAAFFSRRGVSLRRSARTALSKHRAGRELAPWFALIIEHLIF